MELVRRFAVFTNQYPWQWEPAEAEAFITRSPVAVSTARNYQNTLRLFCGYASDARYGWVNRCLEQFGSARALREIDALLKEYPGALVTTPAAYPLVLVRLTHALIAAGYLTVAPPACTGCGRITEDLRRKTASGRVCGTCAARDSKGTCARCGQARRIYARRPEGSICSACYDKDEQVVTECSGCGRMRRAATRMPDGSARCQFCATRPLRTCSACGQQRTVAGTIGAGPVCASCYQAPQRPCGHCGRTRKIAKRATASTPDLCYGCYQGTSAVCSVCGKTRPCQRISSGSPICRSCRTRPPRPCYRCGRNRPVQAEWPAGPVCVGCYEHVRRWLSALTPCSPVPAGRFQPSCIPCSWHSPQSPTPPP